MPHYPTPTSPGHYYAKLVHPHNMPEKEDWASFDWEVVQVWENSLNAKDPEHLLVFCPGVPKAQPLDAFVWGPDIPPFSSEDYNNYGRVTFGRAVYPKGMES